MVNTPYDNAEVWADIPDLPGYQVSSYGQVFSSYTNRIRKPVAHSGGYLNMMFRAKDRKVIRYVHRLVAFAFCDGYFSGAEVNHIDGDKTNNHFSNLEWVDESANQKHAYANGLNPGRAKISVKIVETEEIFPSVLDCARHLRVTRRRITDVLDKSDNVCKGFHLIRV